MSKCKTKCSNILGTHPSLCFLCSINYSLTVCSLYGLLSVSWNAMWGFDFLLFPFIWSRHIKEIERGLLCNTILSAPLYVHSNFWAVYGTLKCWQSESSFSSSPWFNSHLQSFPISNCCFTLSICQIGHLDSVPLHWRDFSSLSHTAVIGCSGLFCCLTGWFCYNSAVLYTATMCLLTIESGTQMCKEKA